VGDRDVRETGTFPGGDSRGGPETTYNIANNFAWETNPAGNQNTGFEQYTGVCFQRSEINLKQVTDGSSQTYIIGEKYLDPQNYETGADPGDNENWGTGFNNDVNRCGSRQPLQDQMGFADSFRFGGVHVGGWFAVFCDGHVESISYDIDLNVHKMNSNRADGGRPN
jgi:hypothetical protein